MLGCSKTCCSPKAFLVQHVEGTSAGFEVVDLWVPGELLSPGQFLSSHNGLKICWCTVDGQK